MTAQQKYGHWLEKVMPVTLAVLSPLIRLYCLVLTPKEHPRRKVILIFVFSLVILVDCDELILSKNCLV